MAQAEAGTGIEQRRALREKDIYSDELTGAQNAAAAAQTAKAAAITGAVQGAGSALTAIEKAGKAYKAKKAGITDELIA
jgi:hypothetical protein